MVTSFELSFQESSAKKEENMKKTKSQKQNRGPQRAGRVGAKKVGVVNYPVGDFLIRLKNATLARKHTFSLANTRLISAVAKTLKNEGFLEEVSEKEKKLFVRIAYKKKEPVMLDLRLVSKPGLRVYMGVDNIQELKGPSVLILSTPKGVMSSREAIKRRLGGEVIAEVI